MKPNLVISLCLLAAIILTGCAGAGGGYNLGPAENPFGSLGAKTLEGGVPTGYWGSYPMTRQSNRVVWEKLGLAINDAGYGTLEVASAITYAVGQGVSYGPLAGSNKVVWRTKLVFRKIAREGSKLYAYPEGPPKLSGNFPAGFSLADYESVGGFPSLKLNQDGVMIFEISGKDLILRSTSDGRHWKMQRNYTR
jgi:hypothetical protein